MTEPIIEQVAGSPSKERYRTRSITRIGAIVAAAAILGGVTVGVLQTTGGRQRTAGATVLSPPAVTSSSSPTNDTPGLTQALAEVPSQATETSALNSAGVHISVNGETLPVRAIGLAVIGAEKSAIVSDVTAADGAVVSTGSTSSASISPPSGVGTSSLPGASSTPIKSAKAIGQTVVSQAATTSLLHAVAVSVLRDLLWQTAQQEGSVVTLATAQAFAQNQLSQYEAAAAAGDTVPSLPNGETAQEAFASTGAVHSYQQVLTIQNEESAVAGTPSTTVRVGESTISRTPALAAWMSKALATANVTLSNVNGVSVSQLPADLPTTL
ncbi:MAG: hypothetical protein ACRDZR_00930 [Acidimicrobiales bacterium]